jgi:hypothetical protein
MDPVLAVLVGNEPGNEAAENISTDYRAWIEAVLSRLEGDSTSVLLRFFLEDKKAFGAWKSADIDDRILSQASESHFAWIDQ